MNSLEDFNSQNSFNLNFTFFLGTLSRLQLLLDLSLSLFSLSPIATRPRQGQNVRGGHGGRAGGAAARGVPPVRGRRAERGERGRLLREGRVRRGTGQEGAAGGGRRRDEDQLPRGGAGLLGQRGGRERDMYLYSMQVQLFFFMGNCIEYVVQHVRPLS